MHNIKKNSGFTLIEILVASVILFSVIASSTMIYKGAYLASEKANSNINITGTVPILLNTIRNQVRAEGGSEQLEISGEGTIWGGSYHWKAYQVAFKEAPEVFNPDEGKLVSGNKKYKLWHVNLDISYKTSIKNYQFNEVSWNDK